MRQLAIFLVFFAAFYSVQTETPAFCDLLEDAGTGSQENIMIYLRYDRAKDGCYPFRYTGQGGNANRFTSEKLCIRNCSENAESLYPVDESAACHLPKDIGECYGSNLRFYYDAIHAKCKSLMWTGCAGNGNRFLDQLSCNATCAGIHDEGDAEEEVESDTNVALIIGMVFGIVGAIIIIVVIVLVVKKKKHSAKKTLSEPKGTAPGPQVPLHDEAIEMS